MAKKIIRSRDPKAGRVTQKDLTSKLLDLEIQIFVSLISSLSGLRRRKEVQTKKRSWDDRKKEVETKERTWDARKKMRGKTVKTQERRNEVETKERRCDERKKERKKEVETKERKK